MKISGRAYNILKWAAQLLLPAAGTLYLALAGIWGLPFGEEVAGTITAADTFLGVMLSLFSEKTAKDTDTEPEPRSSLSTK